MKQTLLLLNSITNAMSSASDLPLALRQALIGQLLGDAYADKSSPTSNTRISWSFGTAFQDYALFMHSLYMDYCAKGVYPVNVKAKKDGRSYCNYRLKTASVAVFNDYYAMFYRLNSATGKFEKQVPEAIMELMNPITLAHLIMGDGNFDSERNRVRIYTNSFSYEDCLRLAQSITSMGIQTSVMFDKSGKKGSQYILTIGAMQLDLLRSTVTPHMCSSMLYRIGSKPNLSL